MNDGLVLWVLLILPAASGLASLVFRSPRAILAATCAGVLGSAAVALGTAAAVFARGRIFAAGSWLFLDPLSAFHLCVMMLVFALSSIYALRYFAQEIRGGTLTTGKARQFAALWSGALTAMTLVLVSNNLGILWVGIEATTLLTAFLICLHVTPTSLEAMWKYLLICSVGVALAFLGTILVAASASGLHLGLSEALLWTRLDENAARLDPRSVRAGFLFLLVGYGTKAGLAPMHSWLPDAHSQAPAPVSAIFSGFMLNAALYCLMRYLPLVEAADGHSGWGLSLLTGFGLLSILVAAAFIAFQHDLKRLLAYHSVEHLGIITLGLGLGGLGTFAALFHTLNHSVCKSLSFFAAGRLGQMYGTHDMRTIRGTLRAAPLWGLGLFASLLALIGAAPFAIFMSELLILKAAVERGAIWALVLFLAGASVVFVGALGHAISMAWDAPERPPEPERAGPVDALLVLGPLAALLVLGLWMPEGLGHALDQAARVVRGGP